MGQVVVNVGSFDLTSYNGNTAYSSVRYFNIPANAGITGCVATFAQHVNTGSFQGKSFSLNSVQAHPNTPWPTSGIALNPALLITGQNAFRAAAKSQAGLSARWSIGDIFLTIDYTDVAVPDPELPPPPNIGTLSINKTVMTLGDTLSVSVSACDAGITRSLYLMLADNSVISYIYIGWGSSANVWSVTVPEGMFATYAGDTDSLILRVYMEAAQGPTLINALAKNFTVNAPASAVPTIGAFTATRNANGVDASITNYVQNYSKVNLEMGSVAGALGSSIQSYEITGAGFSAATASAAFGPFAQAGDITFTAKVTDTRGRTATRTVTINVLPYTPVSGVNLLAYRSDGSMGADDEGAYATLRGRRVFSSLDGQNAGTIKGRVYEKDTTPGGWTATSDDTLLLLGGSMSIEKGYTAEISINDKITSVVYVFQIPTAIVGIHITPGATGGGFGMYGRDGCWDFSAPIFSPEGACPGIGDILYTLNPTHPAIRFPGTTWAAHEGVFLLGADESHEAGDTGGEATHALTAAEMPIHYHRQQRYDWNGIIADAWAPLSGGSGGSQGGHMPTAGNALGMSWTYRTDLGAVNTQNAGSGDAHNNMPPFLSAYMWERTA